MRMTKMHPYQFSKFELYLMGRLENVFHKYDLFEFLRWPRIYWGNRSDSDLPSPNQKNFDSVNERYNPKYQVDLLGVYYHETHEEGFIELYADRIEESAKSISIQLDLNFEITYELLRVTVLLHEIGHWLTHWCIKYEKHSRQSAFCELAYDKHITETMAQLSVIWACNGLRNPRVKNLLAIMDFLADEQPPPYFQYKKLGKNQTKISTIQKRYIKLLDLLSLDIEYLLMLSNNPDSLKSIYSQNK